AGPVNVHEHDYVYVYVYDHVHVHVHVLKMRVLIVTKIFPNAREPLSAPFNRQQFAALARRCEVEVLASIPWFPGAGAFGKWSSAGRLTKLARCDRIDGVDVEHPRTLYVPRFGHVLSAGLYAASMLPAVLK